MCAGGRSLYIHGNLFDIDDEEYRFVSHAGDAYFINSDKIEYSDELDEEARREDNDDDLDEE